MDTTMNSVNVVTMNRQYTTPTFDIGRSMARFVESTKLRVAVIALVSLSMIACGFQDVVDIINNSTPIALVLLNAVGIDIPIEAAPAISAITTCLTFSAAELATLDAPADKRAKIITQCSDAAIIAIPGSVPQKYKDLAKLLQTYITNLLARLPKVSPALTAHRAQPGHVVKLTRRERMINDLSGIQRVKLIDDANQVKTAQQSMALRLKSPKK